MKNDGDKFFDEIFDKFIKEKIHKFAKYQEYTDNANHINDLFKEKIHAKCLSQINNLTKNCSVKKEESFNFSTIAPLIEKDIQCREAINQLENCQSQIQEVYQFYQSIIDTAKTFKKNQREMCLLDCKELLKDKGDLKQTNECLENCVNVIFYGYKSYYFFLQDQRKRIINDLKNL